MGGGFTIQATFDKRLVWQRLADGGRIIIHNTNKLDGKSGLFKEVLNGQEKENKRVQQIYSRLSPGF